MKYQTIAAAFDTRARAQAAANALKAAGFHAADISLLDKEVSPDGPAWTDKSPSLWQRIFGADVREHEAAVYHQTVERGGADLNPLRVAKIGVGRLLGMHCRPACHHPGESGPHKPSRNS